MKIFVTIESIRKICREKRLNGAKIGLVPTMGALHEGHLSLVRIAKEKADFVVVSIFVNPIQFSPSEDFEKYPRNLERDSTLLEEAGADAVFAPNVKIIYPENFSTFVEVKGISEHLCGEFRPGHFKGVTTVVCKLFNIICPDFAVFGEKDAQQLAVIKKMIYDLNMDIKIISAPIIREKDGLAMSSRNVYLNPDERYEAATIYRSLREGKNIANSGETSRVKIVEIIRSILQSSPLIKVEYIEIVDSQSMKPVDLVKEGALIMIAVRIGKTRLIDNISI